MVNPNGEGAIASSSKDAYAVSEAGLIKSRFDHIPVPITGLREIGQVSFDPANPDECTIEINFVVNGQPFLQTENTHRNFYVWMDTVKVESPPSTAITYDPEQKTVKCTLDLSSHPWEKSVIVEFEYITIPVPVTRMWFRLVKNNNNNYLYAMGGYREAEDENFLCQRFARS